MSVRLLKPRNIVQCYSSVFSQTSSHRYRHAHTPTVRSLISHPFTSHRSFHSTRSTRAPLIPIPAIILSVIKTGSLVSLVSLSSKTSLTLLPHTFRRDRIRWLAKVLASIPILGLSLLILVGLDQAPNTSRLRFVYLTEEEEEELVHLEIDQLLELHYGLVAPKNNEYVQWLQTIADNIALVAEDDIRDPVRCYSSKTPTENMSKRHYNVNIMCDSSTMNAMCAGSQVLVYDLMIQYMDYDTNKLAVILSHEIAHSIQRHFVETHGFASLMFMLGDITRGLFWIVTESLGPYVNQKINETISEFITMEAQTSYNRILEKEADLVGLKLLAKAGYDPTIALEVWTKMAELDVEMKKEGTVVTKTKNDTTGDPSSHQKRQYKDLEIDVRQFVDTLLQAWFGSSHPPSQERLEYMQANMQDAIRIYEESLRINGPPQEYQFKSREPLSQIQETDGRSLHIWISSVFSWISMYFS